MMNYLKGHADNSAFKKASFGSYLVGAYLFSVPVVSYSADLELNFIAQLFGLIVFSYAILDFIKTNHLNIPSEIKIYALFVLWVVFTTLLVGKSDNYDSLLTSLKIGLVTLGVAQLIKNDKDFHNALFIYGLSILFVAYLNYDTLKYLQFESWTVKINQFEGTLENANIVAIYSISIVWLSFLLLLSPNTKLIIKTICIVFVSIALLMIYLCGSKKGMIGIVLFALFAAWLLFQKYKFSLLRTTFAFLAGISLISGALYFVYKAPFYYRLETMPQLIESGSTEIRLYLFKSAIALWSDSGINIFLGIGHDNFRDYNTLRLYSHSTISEVLVSSGIVGFLLYFSALGLLTKNLYVQAKQFIESDHLASVINCSIFMVIIFFFNATAVLYSDRELWPLIGIIGSYSLFLGKSLLKTVRTHAAANQT